MKLSTEDSRTATAAVERAYRATRSGGTPAWLVPLQDQALAAFARSGFPTARHEDWKYTNLARLAGISGELLEKSAHAADTGNFAESVGRLPRRTGDYTLVFVNGRFHPALSELPDGADGIRVTTLAQATDEDRERFSDWIGSSTDADMAAFAALNTAFLTDGICIDILPDTQPAAALHVIFVTDGPPIGT
ncbi:MAG: hypothetical protein ACE5G3_09400, partial [Gammaproteobacteria bacterium]